jgi:hypothetical protein
MDGPLHLFMRLLKKKFHAVVRFACKPAALVFASCYTGVPLALRSVRYCAFDVFI